MRSSTVLARSLLVVLLAGQLLLALHFARGAFAGDEAYYVAKAEYLWRHVAFERAKPEQLTVERGSWGSVDWRPQGYPLFVAVCSGGAFTPSPLRTRVTLAQTLLLAAAILTAFELLASHIRRPGSHLVIAVVLGVAPWPFEFLSQIGPDSLTGVLAFLGVILLCRPSTKATAAGSLLMSATFLLRPEMVAIAPPIIAIALALKHAKRPAVMAAGAGLIAVLLIQVGYRAYFTGSIPRSLFGGYRFFDKGAFDWANSWLGTEHEAYDFVYGLSNGRMQNSLPARAYASASEQRTVQAIIDDVRVHGYSASADARFEAVAAARIRTHPLRCGLLPRIWHAVHLWVNLETNPQTLDLLKGAPATLRRSVLGILLLLKVLLLGGFSFGARRAWQAAAPFRCMVLALAAFVLLRTLLMGLVLNWSVHRYVVEAWLPLIVCSLSSLALKAAGAPAQARAPFRAAGVRQGDQHGSLDPSQSP